MNIIIIDEPVKVLAKLNTHTHTMTFRETGESITCFLSSMPVSNLARKHTHQTRGPKTHCQTDNTKIILLKFEFKNDHFKCSKQTSFDKL